MKNTVFVLLSGICLLTACHSSDNSVLVEPKKDSGVIIKKPILNQVHPVKDNKKPPIINIVDTISTKKTIIYIKDSALTYERISLKLAQIYGARLSECFKKNVIKRTGQPMAWFSTRKAPFFFEAGIPVNARPQKLPPGIRIKELRTDSAVIAHFYGPYDLLHLGYDALEDWLKDHNKNAADAPFEIYITDPVDKKGKPVDPYKIQTDIIIPRK